MFWADRVAKEAIEHCHRTSAPIVTIRSGNSPSGAKHIGNMNDQIRAYFIYLAVMDAGHPARVLQTSDDMDPLRTVPPRVLDRDGEWTDFSGQAAQRFTDFVGWPVCKIPDPFECHSSWGEHFTKILDIGLRDIGVKMETLYVSDLYRTGAFDPLIKEALIKADRVRDIMSKFQERRPADWIPFQVVCESCGKITTRVTRIDLELWMADYECVGGTLQGKYVLKGCGHSGRTSLRNGKLPWRIEWVADWKLFQTDAEPFGKEHYEGSWKSGVVLAKEIFNFDPPVPLVYEFFLVDGQKMSSRLGNVYTLHDLAKVIEPEVVRYIYTKRPLAHRDIAVKALPRFIDEFDNFEGDVFEGTEEQKREKKRVYRFLYETLPSRRPFRIPYSTAAYMAQFYSPEEALVRMAKGGFVPGGLDGEDAKSVLKRVTLAHNWIGLFAGEEYKVSLRVPPVRVDDIKIKEAFGYVSHRLSESEMDGDAVQNFLYETARKFDIPPKDLFLNGYRILLGKETGPRLGPFIATLDKEYVIGIFDTLQV